jgi:cell cycle checkpoint control protein RAD9A
VKLTRIVALTAFVKALTCLSRYGDELTIYATPDSLSLSATNSSKSAYCRFKYQKGFFSKFKLNAPAVAQDLSTEEFEDMVSVTGQLLTKVISRCCMCKYDWIESTEPVSPFYYEAPDHREDC